MEEKTLQELKDEAKSLGLEFPKNATKKIVSELIEDFYAKDSEDNTDPVVIAPEVDEDDEDEVVDESPAELTRAETKAKRIGSRQDALKLIKQQEKANKKTRVVKISMVDKRESSTATHAYFSTGNVSMNIPLDIAVEMPIILIEMAKKDKAIVHQEQNGTVVTKEQKKYIVEYIQ